MLSPGIRNHRHRHRLLGAALLFFHAALVLPGEQAVQTPAILIHFALILLWQPFFDNSRRFNRGLTIATLVIGVAIIAWDTWVIPALWSLVLLGLVGGESAAARRDSIAQWNAITYLFIGLLTGIAPGLFDVAGADDPALDWMLLGAGVLPVALLAIPATAAPTTPIRFDHLRSPGITLLTLLLVASTVLWSFQSGTAYAIALVQALPSAGAVLLVLNWVWERASRHSTIELLWNRYLLNLGTPFEQYLMRLTGPSAQHLTPPQYLDYVVAALHELDWVAGVEAQAPDGERRLGDCAGYSTRLSGDQLALVVYTRRDPGPALRLHTHLLLRLAHQLWDARRREAQLQAQERMRAVYETGARLTHDVKNLLQSLEWLTAAVSSPPAERKGEVLELVQRQLPPINQRLHATLEKLRDPGEDAEVEPIPLREWWGDLQARYADSGVQFAEVENDTSEDGIIPREVFDTAIENLLENARYKQSVDRDITVGARLSGDAEQVRIDVIDGGDAVPAEHVDRLFTTPLDSDKGLGVGLYQAAHLAAVHGYELTLIDNVPGRVRFSLRGPLYGAS